MPWISAQGRPLVFAMRTVIALCDPIREKHKKSKKKKKKKEREKDRPHKHKRDRSQLDPQADLDEPSLKKLKDTGGAATAPAASSAAVAAAFKELLTHLLKQLEKKDTNQFFLEPVTDVIAPGYSSIISEPMCFVTMRGKIEQGAYASLKEYENDVKLIVSNCLKYNGPDTVYYSAGKKLLSAAQSVLSKDKLLALKKDMPSVAVLPYEVVGVHLESANEGADSGGDDRTDSPNSQDSRSEGDDEEDGDGDGTEDSETEATRVAEVAAQAARAAARTLHHKKPTSTVRVLCGVCVLGCCVCVVCCVCGVLCVCCVCCGVCCVCAACVVMGYLKTRPDGSVGFTFLSGCGGSSGSGSSGSGSGSSGSGSTGSSSTGSGPLQQDSKPLNLGLVLGKLTAGSSCLHNYHDDKRTMAKPVKPIHYGSYSSFCPSYDSTFSNLSKEESDLVRATYGNETAVQYAESICEFSRDCGMATTLVDQLLNLLTTGQHSRTRATIAAHQQHQQQLIQQQQQIRSHFGERYDHCGVW
ncbi:Protein of unknown function DUF3512 [Trinorchestia longiramus]|nr:Protein of unknown function DUF3512 [Trinorchestia longiramus]